MIDVLRALWLLVATLVPAVAGYGISVRFFRDRGVFDRLLVAIMSFVSLIVVTFLLADQLRPIGPVSLFLISILGSIGVLKWLSVKGTGPREVLAQLREDLRVPKRLWADALETKEPTVLLIIPAVLILGWCVFMVLFFRSWGWDVLMFHTTITNTIVQDGSLAFMDTGFHQARGYPRNVHLLAAWSGFFLGNNALDDAPQLPFGLIGMLVSAAWARRFGSVACARDRARRGVAVFLSRLPAVAVGARGRGVRGVARHRRVLLGVLPREARSLGLGNGVRPVPRHQTHGLVSPRDVRADSRRPRALGVEGLDHAWSALPRSGRLRGVAAAARWAQVPAERAGDGQPGVALQDDGAHLRSAAR
jgi:hypothetical protein